MQQRFTFFRLIQTILETQTKDVDGSGTAIAESFLWRRPAEGRFALCTHPRIGGIWHWDFTFMSDINQTRFFSQKLTKIEKMEKMEIRP
jgi:hypothetical protein